MIDTWSRFGCGLLLDGGPKSAALATTCVGWTGFAGGSKAAESATSFRVRWYVAALLRPACQPGRNRGQRHRPGDQVALQVAHAQLFQQRSGVLRLDALGDARHV